MTNIDTIARIEALLAAMDAEANDYSANKRDDERSPYDKGADDQLDTDRRRLREALEGKTP